MQQFSLDFEFAACNGARKRNAPPEPDRNWLFDAAGVQVIATRRQCAVALKSELIADVQGFIHRRAAANPHAPQKPAPITLTATQPGRWHPVDILAACTKASGGTPYDVDIDKAIVTNPPVGDERLDEIKIARVVGADGMRPYLSRYMRLAGIPRGTPTYAFRALLKGERSLTAVRRALRALEDTGLVDIELGPRGGLATATVTWKPRAVLVPQLSLADHDAIAEIAAVRL